MFKKKVNKKMYEIESIDDLTFQKCLSDPAKVIFSWRGKLYAFRKLHFVLTFWF